MHTEDWRPCGGHLRILTTMPIHQGPSSPEGLLPPSPNWRPLNTLTPQHGRPGPEPQVDGPGVCARPAASNSWSLLGLGLLSCKATRSNKIGPVEHLPDAGSALSTFNTFSVLTTANSWCRASAQEMQAVPCLLSFCPVFLISQLQGAF